MSAKICPHSDLYLTEKSSYEHSGYTFTVTPGEPMM